MWQGAVASLLAGVSSLRADQGQGTLVVCITDRGCPPGFYYALPDGFKVPNTSNGGFVSVPWLSNDLILCFRSNPIFTGSRIPYGAMLWGDFSAYQLPANAPDGTRVVAADGLFVPMVLNTGINQLKLDFPAAK